MIVLDVGATRAVGATGDLPDRLTLGDSNPERTFGFDGDKALRLGSLCANELGP